MKMKQKHSTAVELQDTKCEFLSRPMETLPWKQVLNSLEMQDTKLTGAEQEPEILIHWCGLPESQNANEQVKMLNCEFSM